MSDGGVTTTFQLKLAAGVEKAVRRVSDSPDDTLRRHDQETGRRLANGFAEEALLELVSMMRTSKDESIKLRCIKMITDRAWGQTKALTEEEKKGADAGSILDVLASVSLTQTGLENEARGHATKQLDHIEGEAIVLDAESLLEEIERERAE